MGDLLGSHGPMGVLEFGLSGAWLEAALTTD